MIDLATTRRTHLTVPECIQILGRSRVTIYRWIWTGKLPGEKIRVANANTADGMVLRIPVAHVRALVGFLAQHPLDTVQLADVRHLYRPSAKSA